MRIALFTETFLPNIDGIVTTLCALLDDLAERRHQVIVFAPEGSPRAYAGAQVVSLPRSTWRHHLALPFGYPISEGLRPLTRFRPELIHVVNPLALGLLGLRYARDLRLSVVASYHTDIPAVAGQWGFPVVAEGFWAYLRWIHNQAANVSAVRSGSRSTGCCFSRSTNRVPYR